MGSYGLRYELRRKRYMGQEIPAWSVLLLRNVKIKVFEL